MNQRYKDYVTVISSIASLSGLTSAVQMTAYWFVFEPSASSHFVTGVLALLSAIAYATTTTAIYSGNRMGVKLNYKVAPLLAILWTLVSITEFFNATFG